jgi:hypothetical protein
LAWYHHHHHHFSCWPIKCCAPKENELAKFQLWALVTQIQGHIAPPPPHPLQKVT